VRTALLILTASEAAVFSERAATEGEHKTLAYPTGASLLGWAARAYETFDDVDRTRIFHSGAVRFSNALPLTASGKVAFPAPQLIVEPKHTHGGVASRALDRSSARVGTPKGGGQYESLGKGLFITGDGEVVDPELGSRLRTATREGAAAEGQLFGYQHVSPDGAPRYAAVLEADDLSDCAWKRLCDRFKVPRLFLGRASNTSSGGGYVCEVRDGDGDVWPAAVIADGSPRVRVWVLSDLAVVDDFGSPCFQPRPETLGLPAGGCLDGTDSAIAVRRYAPWNGKLGRRDLERQVITAGSVLTFAYGRPGAVGSVTAGAVGLWRETGLGRIWVAPPLLDVATGAAPAPGEATVVAPRTTTPSEPLRPEPSELLAWLEARPTWSATSP
jgi:hypothetical protein